MAKKNIKTTAEEIADLEAKIAELKAKIAPLHEALKNASEFDTEFCGNVGELFDKTSKLGGLLRSLETSYKIKKAEEAGLL